MNFVDKAQAQLTNMLDRARILVLASHSVDLLRNVCTQVLWMEAGRIVMQGRAGEVLDAYSKAMHAQAAEAA